MTLLSTWIEGRSLYRFSRGFAMRAQGGDGGVEEPRWQQHTVALEEAREVGVQDVGRAVVARVAARAAVRLYQGLRGLQRVPARIAVGARAGPRVAQVGVRHLGDDLEPEKV